MEEFVSQTTEKLSKPLAPRAVCYTLLILIQSPQMSSFTSCSSTKPLALNSSLHSWLILKPQSKYSQILLPEIIMAMSKFSSTINKGSHIQLLSHLSLIFALHFTNNKLSPCSLLPTLFALSTSRQPCSILLIG